MKFIPRPPDPLDTAGVRKFFNFLWQTFTNPRILKWAQKSASYTVLRTDEYIGVTSTAAPRTVTLPALNSVEDGATFIIKDESGGAAANNITIDGNLTETIDGALTKVINTNHGAVRLIKSGNAWFTI